MLTTNHENILDVALQMTVSCVIAETLWLKFSEMMMQFVPCFALIGVFMIPKCFSAQIDADGTVDYCNTNPNQYSISFLSSIDAKYISKIEQVQIFTRHGARTTTSSLTKYFSENIVSSYDMKFKCDIKTDTNRFVNVVDDTTQSNANDDYITLRTKYLSNGQQIEGNCETGQSVTDLLMQHRINGELLYKRYIETNDTKQQIMNDSTLIDILHNIEKNNFDSRLIVHSTNYERTLASATVLISSLMKNVQNKSKTSKNKNISARKNVILDVIATERFSTPYLPRSNWNIGDKLKDYIDSIVKDDKYDNVWNSDEIKSIRDEYQRITNVTLKQTTPRKFLAAYCAGIELPFNKSFLDKLIDMTNTFNQLQWFNKWNMYHNDSNNDIDSNSSSATASSSSSSARSLNDRNNVYVLTSSPIRYLIGQYILNMTNRHHKNSNNNNNRQEIGEKKAKIIYHSCHDNSVLILLAGLGVSDGMTPIFAEMLQLEIYSIKNEYSGNKNLFPSGHAFRFLRNGQNNVLKFSQCGNMYTIGSQLCDLNVLMNILNQTSMPLYKWQDYVKQYLKKVSDDDKSSGDKDSNSHGSDSDNTNKSDDDGCVVTDSTKKKYIVQGVWIGTGITALFFLIMCIISNVCLFQRIKSKGLISWKKLS